MVVSGLKAQSSREGPYFFAGQTDHGLSGGIHPYYQKSGSGRSGFLFVRNDTLGRLFWTIAEGYFPHTPTLPFQLYTYADPLPTAPWDPSLYWFEWENSAPPCHVLPAPACSLLLRRALAPSALTPVQTLARWQRRGRTTT